MGTNKIYDVEMSDKSGSTDKAQSQNTEKKKSSRRPDIDLIRILLTWGILLYHVVLIYTPYLSYYERIIPETVPSWHLSLLWFVISMNAWNMPMFFFLSGISAFFGLKKRSEKEFRLERVHRLLVPAFFLSLTASFPISLDFFAKLSPNCEELFVNGSVAKKEEDELDWQHCAMFYGFTKNETYGQHLKRFFTPVPSPHQGWFLCYLFVYSQLLVHLFLVVHPNHQENKVGCFSKPYNKIVQIFCCCNFFGYLTPDSDSFIRGVKFWLGNPVKLAIIPSLWIGIVEAALRNWFPDGNLWFFGFFTDICNDIKFIFIFVMGFGLAAADEHDLKNVIKKGRWFNLVIGTIILTIYSGNFFLEYIPWAKWIFWFLRGFAEWLFIIGIYGVFREMFTKSYAWIPFLSEIAMPFYLIHQQVLVAIVAGASWIPYLRSFPIVLVLSTFGTFILSWLITKSGPIRYFFGLPTKKDSILPGKSLNGTVPVLVMSIVFLSISMTVNFV